MLPMTGLLVAIRLIEFVLIFMRRNYSGIASLRMETDLRNDFYAHLQGLQVSFHDNWQSGQLLSRCVADINTIRRYIGFGLVFMIVMVCTFLVVLAMLVRLDPLLALVTGIAAVPVVWLGHRFHREY